MRRLIISMLLVGCGSDVSAPKPLVCEERAEGEIEDCQISGIGTLDELRGLPLLRFDTISELEKLCTQPCGNFDGVIAIQDISNIENLTALRNIRKVAGLTVGGLNDLRSFDGIEAMEIDGTGFLSIGDNPKLESIAALNAPKRFGRAPDSPGDPNRLTINYNPKLRSLKGLENLRELGNAEMSIEFNDSLKNLEGLNNLRVVGPVVRLEIKQNAGLESLDGLDSLESGAGIGIGFNAVLSNISDALPNLKSVEILAVEGNPKVSPCEVDAIAARADIVKVVQFSNGGTEPCD